VRVGGPVGHPDELLDLAAALRLEALLCMGATELQLAIWCVHMQTWVCLTHTDVTLCWTGWLKAYRRLHYVCCPSYDEQEGLAAQLRKHTPIVSGTHRHDSAGGFSAGAMEHEAAAVAHAVCCLRNAWSRTEVK
jgi:hypothetical protein